jgi:hypothetical protein
MCSRWLRAAAKLAVLLAALLLSPDADAAWAETAGLSTGEGSLVSSQMGTSVGQTVVARQIAVTAQVGPTPYYPVGSLRQLFHRGGVLGAMAAGLLGAGPLGVLFGRGVFEDLGSPFSYLGLALQISLWLILGWLICTRWRRGKASEAAALSPRELADPYLRSRDDLHAGLDRAADFDLAGDDTIDPNTEPTARSSAVADPGDERE